MEFMIPLSPGQIFFIISICKYVFDTGQIANSAAGTILVEVGKKVFSRFRKPLPDLSKPELESLLTELTGELKQRDQELVNRIDGSKVDIIDYVEKTIKRGNEAIQDELREHALLKQEIVEILRRLEEASRREEKLEELSKPWVEKPGKVANYVNREESEELVFREIEGDHTVICVVGLPGSGKSALLSKIYEDKDPQKTFWIQILKGNTIDTILDALARFFSGNLIDNVKRKLLSPERDYQGIYDDLRRNFALRDFLLFFDNYHLLEDERFDEFLRSLLELDLKSRVVLASREVAFPLSVSHRTGKVPLHGYTQEEARIYLEDNKVFLDDECFQILCRKTEKMPMLILLAVQTLRGIAEEQYYTFITNLPNKDIKEYLMETVHDTLSPEEQTMMQVLSVLYVPESVERISQLSSIDVGSALDNLENKFLVMRDIIDRYSSHEIIRDFYNGFMKKEIPGFLCDLNTKAYEMYYEDFEAGDIEAGERAIDYAEAIINSCDMEMAKEINSYVPYLRNRVANGFLQIYRPMAAIRILDKALEIDREKGDSKAEAVDLNTLANAYLAMNENSNAIQYAESALKIDEEIGDRRSQAIDMNLLGKAWLASNNTKKAVKYLEGALKIHEEIGDRRQQAIDMNLLGKAWLASNNTKKAVEYLESALKIDEEIGDRRQQAIDMNLLGKAWLASNDTKKAVKYLESALKIHEEIGDRRSQAIDMNLLGKAWLASNNTKKAVEYLEGALKIDEEIGDRRQQAIDMNLLGKAWLASNDTKKAVKYLESALKIHEEIGDRRSQAIDMNLLGKALKKSRRTYEAIQYYDKALQISRELNDIKNISYNLNSLGYIYFESENYARAKEYFKECTEISSRKNPVGSIIALRKLGDIYVIEGKNEKALDCYRKVLKLGRKDRRLERKIYELEKAK